LAYIWPHPYWGNYSKKKIILTSQPKWRDPLYCRRLIHFSDRNNASRFYWWDPSTSPSLAPSGLRRPPLRMTFLYYFCIEQKNPAFTGSFYKNCRNKILWRLLN